MKVYPPGLGSSPPGILQGLRNEISKEDIIYRGVGSLQVRYRDECERCGYVGYKMAEKGVDVGMAVEMVLDSFRSDAECFVVASSDIDLLPAIKAVKQNGKEISYLAFDGKKIHAIANYAERTDFIAKEMVIEAYMKFLNK